MYHHTTSDVCVTCHGVSRLPVAFKRMHNTRVGRHEYVPSAVTFEPGARGVDIRQNTGVVVVKTFIELLLEVALCRCAPRQG